LIYFILQSSLNESKRLSEFGLKQLDFNVQLLESYCSELSKPVTKVVALRQLLDLILGGNLEGVLVPELRTALYDKVNISQLKSLLEKWVPALSCGGLVHLILLIH
jgi:hypothetical protein